LLLKPLVDEFLHYLDAEKGYSPYTIKSYHYDFQTWFRHLRAEGLKPELEAVTPLYVRSFVAGLSDSGLKPATIARRVNALRSFWNYLIDCEYTEKNPCRRIMTPKKEQTLPIYLSEDEVNALLAATEKNFYLDLAFRDRAVLSVLVYTGIRRGELLALRLEDVDMEQRLLAVHMGKGKKERVIPIVEPLAEALGDYLELRPNVSHDSLFTTRDKRPLGRTGLTALFRKALQRSGISRPWQHHTQASAHLRHDATQGRLRSCHHPEAHGAQQPGDDFHLPARGYFEAQRGCGQTAVVRALEERASPGGLEKHIEVRIGLTAVRRRQLGLSTDRSDAQ